MQHLPVPNGATSTDEFILRPHDVSWNGNASDRGATLHAFEVMPDHVHLFVGSDPPWVQAHMAAKFKGITSRVLPHEFLHLRSQLPTLWSRSYFVTSIGYVSDKTIPRYIHTQWERAGS